MEQKPKMKSYFFSKALIIILSLIIMFNGLGLIVAGKRVGKKSWTIFGILYIVIEWVCMISGSGSVIATLLYFASIIHTALICAEYGRLLNLKKNGMDTNSVSSVSVDKEIKSNRIKSDAKQNEIREDESDCGIRIDNIPLDIGSANVKGVSRDKLVIKIMNDDGKIYEFNTAGNVVESFEISGKKYSYGG